MSDQWSCLVSARIRVSNLVCYYNGPCVFSYSSFSLVNLSANDSPGGLSACGCTLDINIFASSSLLTFIFSGPMIHFLACCYIFDQQKNNPRRLIIALSSRVFFESLRLFCLIVLLFCRLIAVVLIVWFWLVCSVYLICSVYLLWFVCLVCSV